MIYSSALDFLKATPAVTAATSKLFSKGEVLAAIMPPVFIEKDGKLVYSKEKTLEAQEKMKNIFR